MRSAARGARWHRMTRSTGTGSKAGTFEGRLPVAGYRQAPDVLPTHSVLTGECPKGRVSDLTAFDRLRRITSRLSRIGVSPDDAIRGYPLVLVHGLLGGLQQLVDAYRK